jgi:hypothetical protein
VLNLVLILVSIYFLQPQCAARRGQFFFSPLIWQRVERKTAARVSDCLSCGVYQARGFRGANSGYAAQPGARLVLVCRTRLQCQPGRHTNPCPSTSVCVRSVDTPGFHCDSRVGCPSPGNSREHERNAECGMRNAECGIGAGRPRAIHRWHGLALRCLRSHALAQCSFGNEARGLRPVGPTIKRSSCRGGTFPGWRPSTS